MKKHIELEISYQKEEKERLIAENDYNRLKGEITEETHLAVRNTIERGFITIMRELENEKSKTMPELQ